MKGFGIFYVYGFIDILLSPGSKDLILLNFNYLGLNNATEQDLFQRKWL